jgi:hypothetical protein
MSGKMIKEKIDGRKYWTFYKTKFRNERLIIDIYEKEITTPYCIEYLANFDKDLHKDMHIDIRHTSNNMFYETYDECFEAWIVKGLSL